MPDSLEEFFSDSSTATATPTQDSLEHYFSESSPSRQSPKSDPLEGFFSEGHADKAPATTQAVAQSIRDVEQLRNTIIIPTTTPVGLTSRDPAARAKAIEDRAKLQKAAESLGIPHFTGSPNEPEGDRAPTMDMERVVAELRKREQSAQDPNTKAALSQQRAYWESELSKYGMTAAEWKSQTGENDPVYPTQPMMFGPTVIPESVAKPLRAVGETAKSFVSPESLKSAATLVSGPPSPQDVLQMAAQKAIRLSRIRTTEPFSQQWWNDVVTEAGEDAMGLAALHGAFPKEIPKPPVQEVIPSASKVTGPESVPQPEVRTQVGKEASFRQQGEAPQTQAETIGGTPEKEKVSQAGQEGQEVLGQPAAAETTVPASTAAAAPPTEPIGVTESIAELQRRNAPAPTRLEEDVAKFAEEQQSPTSIKNAVVDRERTARGLPPADPVARQGFGTVWDETIKAVDQNPTIREDLIEDLKNKPRAINDKEDALLLHKQIELQNDFDKTSQALIDAQSRNDLAAIEENRVRSAQLSDKLLDLYNIGKQAGTQTARGLNARRMLANEDFSLANMVRRKRTANQGKPLTQEQMTETGNLNERIVDAQKALDDHLAKAEERRLKALKTRTRGSIEKLKGKLDTGDFTKEQRQPVKLDQEAFRLKAELERLKAQFQDGLIKDIASKRTMTEKAGDTLVKWRRGFILSSPITLGKLTSAAAQRLAFTPIEEAIGGGISKAFPKLASKATVEGGFSVKAEAKALTEGFTKGMKDSWDVLRTGRSDLDVQFQKQTGLPHSAIDFVGQVHGALKTVPKRAAFARAFEKQVEAGITSGVDVTDPMVQSSYAIQAYKEANKSIFMQDNRVVSAYKRMVSAFEQPDKATGHVPLSSKVLGTTAKVLLPIVKIPTNIVAETMQYAMGTVTGGTRLARAYARGIETLRPEEADLIMRQLKKGSIGAAVMTLGYLNPQVIGGYYEKKRTPGDVKAGNIRVYGHDVPSWLLHNPLLETLQIGATVRRVAGDKLRDVPSGIAAGALGLIDEVPFIREMTEVSKAFKANERAGFFGELAKSLLVPQALQFVAQHYDTAPSGEPMQRKPNSLWEYISSGVPGLRKNVPLKSQRMSIRGAGQRIKQ